MGKTKKPYCGYKRPVPEHLKVVSIYKGQGFERELRWVIIDEDTGEVFDDAQGYGYKTARKAHVALSYKRRPKEKFQEEEKVKRAVGAFCAKYASELRRLDDLRMEAMKRGKSVTEDAVLACFSEVAKADMWFGVKNLLKYQ